MGKRIIIGMLTGLVLATTAGIWSSKHFSKSQKIFLTICVIFPPAQWVFAIIIYAYNKKNDIIIDYKQNINSKDLEKLKHLKNSNLLSDEEYEIKAGKIKTESILNDIKKTGEYKALSQLNKKGILTDNEFDEKIELLNKQITNQGNLTEDQEDSGKELITRLKKRIIDYTEQNFSDSTFLRGTIVTLSLRDDCQNILERYKIKYGRDLCDEIKLFDTYKGNINYILEPLIKKELTQKKY